MIKNVVITNGQLPSVLGRDEGALDQHQPQRNVVLTLLRIGGHIQILHVVLRHTLRIRNPAWSQLATIPTIDRPVSVVNTLIHQDNKYHDTISISPLV